MNDNSHQPIRNHLANLHEAKGEHGQLHDAQLGDAQLGDGQLGDAQLGDTQLNNGQFYTPTPTRQPATATTYYRDYLLPR